MSEIDPKTSNLIDHLCLDMTTSADFANVYSKVTMLLKETIRCKTSFESFVKCSEVMME